MSKIYCILTINFTQLSSRQNVVLMEGMGGVPDECLLSAYNLLRDTKDSVLQEGEVFEQNLTILKDQDFRKMEQSLKIKNF